MPCMDGTLTTSLCTDIIFVIPFPLTIATSFLVRTQILFSFSIQEYRWECISNKMFSFVCVILFIPIFLPSLPHLPYPYHYPYPYLTFPFVFFFTSSCENFHLSVRPSSPSLPWLQLYGVHKASANKANLIVSFLFVLKFSSASIRQNNCGMEFFYIYSISFM